jgi:tRNA (adenine57-N1/adenine58-N1)-methyltransferase
LNTIELREGGTFQSHKGFFRHSELIGKPEGSVVSNTEGTEYLAFRPLLSDYVLSMPRGAAVIYPKDAGQIIAMADIFPGAVVVEAGVGSGGLTLALLRAVGDQGTLHSIERRAEFAQVARGNVEKFFGGEHPAWRLHLGDFADQVENVVEPGSVDRIILDMLAPWENLEAAAKALVPGGVFCAYVATTTQLSRLAEDLRASEKFGEPAAFETMVRTWHLEGLAVRPDHRMIGHTGFLLIARRLADGVTPPIRKRRPAKGTITVTEDGEEQMSPHLISAYADSDFSQESMGVRQVSEKRLRKTIREFGLEVPSKDDVDS